MQHGIKTKYHLIDFCYDYGELKWMKSHWTRRGHTRFSHYLRFQKHEFVQAERRRGKRECVEGTQED